MGCAAVLNWVGRVRFHVSDQLQGSQVTLWTLDPFTLGYFNGLALVLLHVASHLVIQSDQLLSETLSGMVTR